MLTPVNANYDGRFQSRRGNRHPFDLSSVSYSGTRLSLRVSKQIKELAIGIPHGKNRERMRYSHSKIALIVTLAVLTATGVVFLLPLMRPVPAPPVAPRYGRTVPQFVTEPFHMGIPPGPGSPPLPDLVHIGPPIAGSYLLQKIDPVSPPPKTPEHIRGEVTIDIVVDREGYVESAKAVSGSPLLFGAALDAVRQWRYRPYLLNGQPIRFQTKVVVQFR